MKLIIKGLQILRWESDNLAWSRTKFYLFPWAMALLTIIPAPIALQANVCAPNEFEELQEAVKQVTSQPEQPEAGLLKPVGDPLSTSVAINNLFNVYQEYRRVKNWNVLSDETRSSFLQPVFSPYGIDALSKEGIEKLSQDDPRQIPAATLRILSFYLRWLGPQFDKVSSSQSFADFPVSQDPSLAQFLGVSPDDKRGLAEILLQDFLKDPKKHGKILELARILGTFSLVSDLLLDDADYATMRRQVFAEDPNDKQKSRFPSFSQLETFAHRNLNFGGVGNYRPIFQTRLERLKLEAKGTFDTAMIFESLNFSEADIEEFKRRDAIQKEIDALVKDLAELTSSQKATRATQEAYSRFGSSVVSQIEERITHLQAQLGPISIFNTSSLISDLKKNRREISAIALGRQARASESALQIDRNRGGDSVFISPRDQYGISGMPKLHEGYRKNLQLEVERDFLKAFGVRSWDEFDFKKFKYDPKNFVGFEYADPTSFIPGGRYKKPGRWEYIAPLRDLDSGLSRTGFLGAQKVAEALELTAGQMDSFIHQAIEDETNYRLKLNIAGGSANAGAVGIRKILSTALNYNENGFVKDGERADHSLRWYDPVLERHREQGADYTDIPEEAYEKVELVLDILSQGGERLTAIPLRYANLLMWTKNELAAMAWIRQRLPNYHFGFERFPMPEKDSIPLSLDKELKRPDLRLLQQQVVEIQSFESRLRQVLGTDLKFTYASYDDFIAKRDRFAPVFAKKAQVVPGASLRKLGCFSETETKGELLSDQEEWPKTALSNEEFAKRFSTLSTETTFGKPASFETFVEQLESCLNRFEERRVKMRDSVASSWDHQVNERKVTRMLQILNYYLEAKHILTERKLPEDQKTPYVYQPVKKGPVEERLESIRIMMNGFPQNQRTALDQQIAAGLKNPEGVSDPRLKDLIKRIQKESSMDSIGSFIRVGVYASFTSIDENKSTSAQILWNNMHLFELDALEYLSSRFGWDANITDPNLSGSDVSKRDLDTFLLQSFADNTVRLSAVNSEDLQAAASSIDDALALGVTVFGEDFARQEHEDLYDLRREASSDARAVLTFLHDRQQTIITTHRAAFDNHEFGTSIEAPLDIASVITKDAPSLNELKRWGVPVDNEEHMKRISALAGISFWRAQLEPYLADLYSKGKIRLDEMVTKRRALIESKPFPPKELVDFYFVRQRLETKKFAQAYQKDLKLPENKLSEGQQAQVAKSALGLAAVSSQYVQNGLRSYESFMADFFADPERGSTNSPKQAEIKAILASRRGLERETFEFLGFNPDSENFQIMLGMLEKASYDANAKNREITFKDTLLSYRALWKMKRKIEDVVSTPFIREVKVEAEEFFRSADELNQLISLGGGLDRIAFRKLVRQIESNPTLKTKVIGVSDGQAAEKSKMEAESAKFILDSIGIRWENQSPENQAKILKQLTAFRTFIRTSQVLFPQFEGSLSSMLSSFSAQVAIQSLDERSESGEVESDVMAIFQSPPSQNESLGDSLIRAAGYQYNIDGYLKDRIAAFKNYLSLMHPQNKVDLDDKLFTTLNSLNQKAEIDLDLFFLYASELTSYRDRQMDASSEWSLDSSQEKLEKLISNYIEKIKGIHPDLAKAFEPWAGVLSIKALKLADDAKDEQKKEFEERLKKIKEARSRAFPASGNGVSSIYAEYGNLKERHQEALKALIEDRLSEVLLDPDGAKNVSGRQVLPYEDLLETSTIQVYQYRSRALLWNFLAKKPNDFFNSDRRSQSMEEVGQSMYGANWELIRLRSEGSKTGLESSIESLLKLKNQHRISMLSTEGLKLSTQHQEYFRAWAMETFTRTLAQAKPEEQAAIAEGSWYQFLQGEQNFVKFLKESLKVSDIDAYLESPNISLQRAQMLAEAAAEEKVFEQAGLIGTSFSTEGRQEQWLEGAAASLRQLAHSSSFGVSPLEAMRGLNSYNRSQLEQAYGNLVATQQSLSRKNAFLRAPLYVFQDAGTMLDAGAMGIINEVDRLVVENLFINASWYGSSIAGALTGNSEWGSQGFDWAMNKIKDDPESYFNDEKMKRSNNELAAEIVSDGVGLYLTIATFGGFRAAGAMAKGTWNLGRTSAKAVLKDSAYATLKSGTAGIRRVSGKILNAEPAKIMGLSRSARSARAVAQGARATQEALIVSKGAKAVAEKTLRNRANDVAKAAWQKTKNFGAAAKSMAGPLGTRIAIDNAYLGAANLGATYFVYNQLPENAWGSFGESMKHGAMFMGAMSLIHLSLGRYPFANRLISTSLMNYIYKDWSSNATLFALNRSEYVRSVFNEISEFATGADELLVEEPLYKKYLTEDMLDENGNPLPGALETIPEDVRAEVARSFLQDKEVAARAISGSFLIGLIAGGPLIGRFVDTGKVGVKIGEKEYGLDLPSISAARKIYDGRPVGDVIPTTPSAPVRWLRAAYGRGNPEGLYERLEEFELQRLRALEAAKKPDEARLSEPDLISLAKESTKNRFWDYYDLVNPEQGLIRHVAVWQAQGRPMASMKAEARQNLIKGYQDVYESEFPIIAQGERALAAINPKAPGSFRERIRDLWNGFTLGKSNKAVGSKVELKEALEIFDRAWDEGVEVGLRIQALRGNKSSAEAPSVESMMGQLAYLQMRVKDLMAEGKPLSSQAIESALNEIAPSHYWSTPSGRFTVAEVIMPMLKASLNGRSQFLTGLEMASPETTQSLRNFWAERSRLEGDPNQPALYRFAEVDVVNPAQTNIHRYFKDTQSSPIGKIYDEAGKTYLEFGGLRVELPAGVGAKFTIGGRLVLSKDGKFFEISDRKAMTDFASDLRLFSQTAPSDVSTIKGLGNQPETLAPRILMYKVKQKIDGKVVEIEAPVLVFRVNSNVEVAKLPDGTYAARFLGKAKRGTPTEFLLPDGIEIRPSESGRLIFRDRFGLETELNFESNQWNVYQVSTTGKRMDLLAGFGKKLKSGEYVPHNLKEFQLHLDTFPGTVPSEFSAMTELIGIAKTLDFSMMEPKLRQALEGVKVDNALREFGVSINGPQERSRLSIDTTSLGKLKSQAMEPFHPRATSKDISVHPTGHRLHEIYINPTMTNAELAAQIGPRHLIRFLTKSRLEQIAKEAGLDSSNSQYIKIWEAYRRAESAAPSTTFGSVLRQERVTDSVLRELSNEDFLFLESLLVRSRRLSETFNREELEFGFRITRKLEQIERSEVIIRDFAKNQGSKQVRESLQIEANAKPEQINAAIQVKVNDAYAQFVGREIARLMEGKETIFDLIVSKDELLRKLDEMKIERGKALALFGDRFSPEQWQRGISDAEVMSIKPSEAYRDLSHSDILHKLIFAEIDLRSILSLSELQASRASVSERLAKSGYIDTTHPLFNLRQLIQELERLEATRQSLMSQ